MARQIKLRMWNGVAKKYHYDVENVLQCLAQQNVYDGTMTSRGFTIGYNHIGEGSVFEEFIGLLDKNGKEVYEGDKVVALIKHNGHHIDTLSNGTVIYSSESSAFLISFILQGAKTLVGFGSIKKLEITGNIHESEVSHE